VACLTPDDHVVMVVMNDSADDRRFHVTYDGGSAGLELAAGAVGTFRWKAGSASF